MKLIFALIPLLVTSIASANTVRIGNGGDTIKMDSPGIVSYILTSPYKLRLITHAWMKNKNNTLILPKERFKEFEQTILDTPLEIQQDPCLVNGKPKTAAAYQTPYKSICVSTKRLALRAGKQLPELQVIALLGHEYLHLLGYDEADAISFQRDIINHLAQFGIPTYNSYVLNPITNDFSNLFKTVDWTDKLAVAKFSQGLNDSIKGSLQNLIAQQSSNYPILTEENNIISDIQIRASYLNLMVAANWGAGPDIDELRLLLSTRYFPIMKNGMRMPNTASSISQLFRYSISYPLLYPKMAIPYIDGEAGKETFTAVIAETDRLIEELNGSLQKMELISSPVRFIDTQH